MSQFDSSGWTLIVITLVVFIIIIAIIIFYSINSRTTGSVNEKFCPPNLCSVSVISGLKTCPDVEGGQVTQNPALEYCSSRNFCQNSRFPCALLPDGSTDCRGECGPNNENCPCISNVLCAPYIASYFIRGLNQFGGLEFVTQASTYIDPFNRGEETFTSGGSINLGSFTSPIGACVVSEEQLPFMKPPECMNGRLSKITGTTNSACVYTDVNCIIPEIRHVGVDGVVTCAIP